MTTLIATSVLRGSPVGEVHGQAYLVDLAAERAARVIDWRSTEIDWQGHGGGRGLRGIAFHEEQVLIAASDELLVYSPQFEPRGSYRNAFLRHCHEICVYEGSVFLTSAGFDTVLGFDLRERRFFWGLHILVGEGGGIRGVPFNPESGRGPSFSNRLHLNSVHCEARGMFISGLHTGGILAFDGKRIVPWAHLPQGVHNARPWRDGVLFNDTQSDVVRYASREGDRVFHVPRYEPSQLTSAGLQDARVARQAFARGLCVLDADIIAAGSSPATIALHDLRQLATTRTVTLSADVRNSIHGLEVWPF